MINSKINYCGSTPETFLDVERCELLPGNRVPSLLQIMKQFETGRVNDDLVRDLPFNGVERNPFLQKDFDMADYPDVAKEIDTTLEDVTEQVRKAKLAKEKSDVKLAPEEPTNLNSDN